MHSKKGITRTQVLAIAVVVIIIFTGLGWYISTMPAPSPPPTVTTTPTATPAEQTLVIGTTKSIENLDPAITGKVVDYVIGGLVCDHLLTRSLDGTKVIPMLATDWSISEDGKAVDLYLRRGVKFQDGTPFNAESAKYSIDRAWKIHGPLSYTMAKIDWGRGDEAIEIIDEYTLRIHLEKPSITFINDLATNAFPSMVPPVACESAGDRWGTSVLIGTGPFKLVEFVERDRVVLERWDEYRGTKPILKTIIVKSLPDATTARLALEKGEIDVFYMTPSPFDIPAMQENPDVATYKVLGGWGRYLIFNTRFPSLDNKLVRQAIAYAIDIERVVKDGFKSLGEPAYGMMQPWMSPWYFTSMKKYQPRNVTKAKELLAKAGYPEGFELELSYTPTYHPADVMVVIKDELEEVGIKCTIQMLEYAKWVASYGELACATYSWLADYPDPRHLIDEQIGPGFGYYYVVTNWNNTRYYEILRIADSIFNQTERQELYREAEEIIAEEVPWIPLIYEYKWIFARKWVKNFNVYPTVVNDALMFAECYVERG